MSEKKEFVYYVAGFGLMAIALFLDIYFITQSGTPHEDWLGHLFKGTWNDWLGIVLFNASCIGMGLGILGYWEVVTASGSGLNKTWLVSLAIAIGLICL